MKKIFMIMLLACNATVFAQEDSTKKDLDTIRVGNMIIVKKDVGKNKSVKMYTSEKKKTSSSNKNITTKWLIMDIGYAGTRDLTDYTSAAASAFMPNAGTTPINAGDFSLRSTRISNFNLWFFMQKRNIYKHFLNLKYGLGIESNNYFYKSSLTYVDDPNPYVKRDNLSFSKNKLVANYITVPFMLNINTYPRAKRKGLDLSFGVSGGMLYRSHQKQKSSERGTQKQRSDFNLERFRFAMIGELGIGPVKLYGSYALTPLHSYGVELMPYTVGFRLGDL